MLTIAGTSCGGVSYAHRILNESNSSQTNPIVVKVTDGKFHEQVKSKVLVGVSEINKAIARQSYGKHDPISVTFVK